MTERLRDSLAGDATSGWLDRLKLSRDSAGDRWQPRPVKSGACQQVVRLGSDVDLSALPALRNRPGEAGRFFHSTMVLAVDANDGERRVDRCDLLVLDKDRIAILDGPRQSVWRLLADYLNRRQRMPLAVVLGGDPAYRLLSGSSLAAALPGPAARRPSSRATNRIGESPYCRFQRSSRRRHCA